MFRCLILIFPLLIAADEDDNDIFGGAPPKSAKEFANEYQPPPPAAQAITVVHVDSTTKNGKVIRVVITLSDGRKFQIHPSNFETAEAWGLGGPEVEVKTTPKSEEYSYKIFRKGSKTFVYGRLITDPPPSQE